MGKKARRFIPKWGDAIRAPSPGRSDIDFGITMARAGRLFFRPRWLGPPGLNLKLIEGQKPRLGFVSRAKPVSFLGQFEICLRYFPRTQKSNADPKGSK